MASAPPVCYPCCSGQLVGEDPLARLGQVNPVSSQQTQLLKGRSIIAEAKTLRLLEGCWLCRASPLPAPSTITAAPRAPAPAGRASAPSPSLSVSLLPDCQEEASKLRFLASICTLCRAWLQGRYLPGFRSACELVEKMEVLRQKEFLRSVDAVLWRQAVLAIAAMSEEREGLLDQHLRPCIRSIFCLAPAQKMDSQRASLDAQILKTLDSVLEVLTHGASLRSSILTVEQILQVRHLPRAELTGPLPCLTLKRCDLLERAHPSLEPTQWKESECPSQAPCSGSWHC
ncbi:uncharacterized protein WM294_016645 [Sarcoramphus papa]